MKIEAIRVKRKVPVIHLSNNFGKNFKVVPHHNQWKENQEDLKIWINSIAIMKEAKTNNRKGEHF